LRIYRRVRSRWRWRIFLSTAEALAGAMNMPHS
jgi:hypothetical protein